MRSAFAILFCALLVLAQAAGTSYVAMAGAPSPNSDSACRQTCCCAPQPNQNPIPISAAPVASPVKQLQLAQAITRFSLSLFCPESVKFSAPSRSPRAFELVPLYTRTCSFLI